MNKSLRPPDASAVVRGALEPLVRSGILSRADGGTAFLVSGEQDAMRTARASLQELIDQLSSQ